MPLETLARYNSFNICLNNGILINFRTTASASQEIAGESQSSPVGSPRKSVENGPPVSENFKRSRGHRRQDSFQESIFTMSAQELK